MDGNGLDRDEMARWYANRHMMTDDGIRSIYYLPKLAPDREIRLLEVNEAIAVGENAPLEPIDFGVDVGSDTAHILMVLDITPSQWEKVQSDPRLLPNGWTLDGATPLFSR